MVLALATHTAAAQTERATALIERALALRGDVTNGKSLYKNFCASCHGEQAYGNPATVTPSLAGQLPLYLIKQLVDFAEDDRTAPEMHRVVALKQLVSPQAIRDLATYLAACLPIRSRRLAMARIWRRASATTRVCAPFVMAQARKATSSTQRRRCGTSTIRTC